MSAILNVNTAIFNIYYNNKDINQLQNDGLLWFFLHTSREDVNWKASQRAVFNIKIPY